MIIPSLVRNLRGVLRDVRSVSDDNAETGVVPGVYPLENDPVILRCED